MVEEEEDSELTMNIRSLINQSNLCMITRTLFNIEIGKKEEEASLLLAYSW